MNSSQARMLLALSIPAALAALLLASTGAAQAPKAKAGTAHDVVFLTDAQPLLIRMHVRLDGKTLDAAHDDFVTYLFQHLDRSGRGLLDNAALDNRDIARCPPMSHIKAGRLDAVFGGVDMPNSPKRPDSTLADFAKGRPVTR